LLLVVSAVGLAQHPGLSEGPIDINELRRHVMARQFDMTDQRWPTELDSAPSGTLIPEQEANLVPDPIWPEWGLRVAPVPQVLYMHCPQLKQDAGLMIEAVLPGGPAERSGLVPGQVIAGTDQRWLAWPDELPGSDGPQDLVVLVAGKLRKVRVEPIPAAEAVTGPAAGSAAELGATRPNPPVSSRTSSAVARSGGRSVASSASSSTGGGNQAISMACANGHYEIEASCVTPEGRLKYRLSGTRSEIENSMADLPPSLRQAIEHRLDTVSAQEPTW
jgi:hypothetical protein